MSRTIAWTLAAVLALGAIGCGSSSDESRNAAASSTSDTQSTATTPPAAKREKPPKEPFARQVFAACQHRDAQVTAFTKSHEHTKPSVEIGDLARALPPIETERLDALEAITAPARFQSAYAQFKAALRARRDALAQWATDNPTGTISRPVIRAVERTGQRATQLASRLRLKCSV